MRKAGVGQLHRMISIGEADVLLQILSTCKIFTAPAVKMRTIDADDMLSMQQGCHS